MVRLALKPARVVAALVIALVALGLHVATVHADATNIVAGGSFESPFVADGDWDYPVGEQIGPWTVASGEVSQLGTYWQAADGAQSLDLNGDFRGIVYQDLATEPDRSYTLRFAMAATVGSEAGCPNSSYPYQVGVDWDGATVASPGFDGSTTTPKAMGWTYQHYTVKATGPTTRLQFSSLGPDGQCGPAIDDVSAVILPLPPPPPPTESSSKTGSSKSGGSSGASGSSGSASAAGPPSSWNKVPEPPAWFDSAPPVVKDYFRQFEATASGLAWTLARSTAHGLARHRGLRVPLATPAGRFLVTVKRGRAFLLRADVTSPGAGSDALDLRPSASARRTLRRWRGVGPLTLRLVYTPPTGWQSFRTTRKLGLAASRSPCRGASACGTVTPRLEGDACPAGQTQSWLPTVPCALVKGLV